MFSLSHKKLKQTAFDLTSNYGKITIELNDTFIVLEKNLINLNTGNIIQFLDDKCINLQSIYNSIYISLENGDCLMINSATNELEVVGTVDAGIEAMKWSPDLELNVILTKEKHLLLMTNDFNLINEVILVADVEGEDTPVVLGWGKKETQFHGSLGKQAAVEKQSKIHLSQNDDNLSRISWRGDGNFFCVNTILDEKRQVLIFNRDGVLQSKSEFVNEMEGVVSWKPSGNLIASCQKVGKRHDIIFFEKNGLRHGEFQLQEPETSKIREILWNSDSTILSILVERSGLKRSTVVLLYTTKNYHWYLSKEIQADKEGLLLDVFWDPENPLKLHLLTSTGCYICHEFNFEIFVSTSLFHLNPSTVAVIDGSSVLLTPFKYKNTPPPMSHFKLQFPCNITHVSFFGSKEGDDLSILDCEQNLHLFKSAYPKEHLRLGSINLTADVANGDYIIRQCFLYEKNIIVAVCNSFEGDFFIFFYINFIEKDTKKIEIKGFEKVDFGLEIMNCFYIINHGFFFQGSDLNIYKVEKTDVYENILKAKFSEICDTFNVIELNYLNGEKELVILGLYRNKLFANGELLSTECISYFVHNDYVVLTTLTHTAKFISVVGLENFSKFKLEDSPSDITKYNENHRRIERGSKIVLATPCDISLIFQMPRGNLETVYPRAFVLSAVRNFLDQVDYKNAFALCRKHRIDMNLIFDYNPKQFFEVVDKGGFIQGGIDDPEYLNLFLSSLRNEDVTISMYRLSLLKHEKYKQKNKNLTKVDEICFAIRKNLQKLDKKNQIKFRTSILTTYVKQDLKDLESSLTMIKSLKDESLEEAEKGLKYIIFLVNVDQLYNVALGMYDFQLCLMVAQNSQKDPREYLPFLSSLKKLNKYYQRFKIDDFLERREKALTNLRLDEKFDECVAYIKKYNLFKFALFLFKDDGDLFNLIKEEYAEYLFSILEYEEAGIMYKLSGNLEKALKSFMMAGLWKDAFSVAFELQLNGDRIKELSDYLTDFLCEKRLYLDAARLNLDYTQNVSAAVELYVKGADYSEAVRICHLSKESNLIETVVKPGVIDAYNMLLEEIDNLKTNFLKQKERLKVVREEKARKILAMGLLPHDDKLNDIDIMSDTSSMATTRITAYTGASNRTGMSNASSLRSARAKRKNERKKASSKEGGIYEEEYLNTSLQKHLINLKSLYSPTTNLIKSLSIFNFLQESKTLQSRFKDLTETFKVGGEEIFPKEVVTDVLTEGQLEPVKEAKIIFDVEEKIYGVSYFREDEKSVYSK